MNRENIANREFRRKVENLQRGGLPDPVPLEKAQSDLSETQRMALLNILDLSDQEEELREKKGLSSKDKQVREVRLQIRTAIQRAILADLEHLGLIQRQALGYGAIPDPKLKWKYFREVCGEGLRCWECGAQILSKPVRYSVRYPKLQLAEDGEIVIMYVRFCSNCEREPSSYGGSLGEMIAESMERELPPDFRS